MIKECSMDQRMFNGRTECGFSWIPFANIDLASVGFSNRAASNQTSSLCLQRTHPCAINSRAASILPDSTKSVENGRWATYLKVPLNVQLQSILVHGGDWSVLQNVEVAALFLYPEYLHQLIPVIQTNERPSTQC